MDPFKLYDNFALITALTGWAVAQIIKPPIGYLRFRKWNWALLLTAGGMPSSHSALVAGLATSIGLYWGFGTPLFAIAFCLAMVVTYDATGIRRQAGRHATVINKMVFQLAAGHPLEVEKLREVLGHTPMEALAGVILGIFIAIIMYQVWF
jgi:uncharacterized protein